ncbi:TPA: metal-dependent transcriptional regulator [bacterium]|nr:metal-dependent transcriptional regulator [bacterium]
MQENFILTNSMEDYLEAISTLKQKKKYVRVKDIAKQMKVKMPSVTGALRTLTEKNLVRHEKYEYVELTEEGITIAEEIKRRHDLIFKFLIQVLRVDTKTAEQDACGIEHSVSPKTVEQLVKLVECIDTCVEGSQCCLLNFNRE